MTDPTQNEQQAEGEAEVYQKLGQLTRQLHDALYKLGYTPRIADIASSLPDAKSRLTYIASKTTDAAEKVLNLVDIARDDHTAMMKASEAFIAAVKAGQAEQALGAFEMAVAASHEKMDGHLTNIMMAQDFHDLTGQVIAKVVALAADIEDQMVKLLVEAAPVEQQRRLEQELSGPVVNPEGRTDVVSSQGEVDDLLASLGF